MFFLATAEMCNACNGVLGITTGIPKQIVDIIALIYDVIRIGVPLILILVGMFDMGKAITQQKEDEIKKAQSLLVKKAIAAALVFLMLSLVTLVLGAVGGDDKSNINCINCLLTGKTTVTQNEGNSCTLTEAQCGANRTVDPTTCTCVDVE